MIYVFIGIYFVCAVVMYAAAFAFWQRTFPLCAKEAYVSDFRLSVFSGVLWPVTILAYLFSREGKNFLKCGFKLY